MDTTLRVVSMVVSVVLVAAVLLQVKGTGAGVFGAAYGTFRTRRGFERLLFRSTIVLAGVFILIAVLSSRFIS